MLESVSLVIMHRTANKTNSVNLIDACPGFRFLEHMWPASGKKIVFLQISAVSLSAVAVVQHDRLNDQEPQTPANGCWTISVHGGKKWGHFVASWSSEQLFRDVTASQRVKART